MLAERRDVRGMGRSGVEQTWDTYVMSYTTVRECMETAGKPSALNPGADVHREEMGQQSWYGAPGFSEAWRRVEEGWPEGFTKVRDALRTLTLPALPKRRKVRFSDDGPDLNLDRFLDGADVCWNVRKRVPVPTVDVSVAIGASCGINASELFWRGAAAVALVDMLERAGYRVRLTALSLSSGTFYLPDGSPLAGFTRVQLKDFAEPMRPGHLAGSICTAALFRIGCFGSRWSAPFRADGGLGFSAEPHASECAKLHVGAGIKDQATAQAVLDKLAKGILTYTASR